jgi:hypothetical protein
MRYYWSLSTKTEVDAVIFDGNSMAPIALCHDIRDAQFIVDALNRTTATWTPNCGERFSDEDGNDLRPQHHQEPESM